MVVIENVTYFQAKGISYNMENAQFTLLGTDLTWEDERDAPTREQIDSWGTEAETRIKLRALRLERNALLQETDWSQSGDVPEETKTKWQTYRQQLRDITNTYSSIDNVIWPTPPT